MEDLAGLGVGFPVLIIATAFLKAQGVNRTWCVGRHKKKLTVN